MTNDERMTKRESAAGCGRGLVSDFGFRISFVIRISSFVIFMSLDRISLTFRTHGADDFLDVFLQPVLRRTRDAPIVMLVLQGLREMIVVLNEVHPQSFAKIDLRHAGLYELADVRHGNAAGAVLHERLLHRGAHY